MRGAVIGRVRRLALVALAGTALVSARSPHENAAAGLLAGAAKVDITPGPEELSAPFTHVHDPVYLRALVLESAGQRVVLVVADVPMLAAPIAAEITRKVAKEAEVPVTHVLLAATHTHNTWRVDTGTEGIFLPGSPRFVKKVSAAAVEAIGKAMAARRPARMSLGRGTARLVANRNQWSVRLGRYIDGVDRTGAEPIDEGLGVASFTDMKGNAIAFVLNYAIEPVVAMALGGEISGDVPGYAERYVEERAGHGAVALFTVGAAGSPLYRVRAHGDDSSPYRPADPEKLIEAMGTILGEEALATAQEGTPLSGTPAIGVLERKLTCPGKRTRPLNLASQCAHTEDSVLPACIFTDSEAPPVDLDMGVIRIGDLYLVSANANVTPALGRKFDRMMPHRGAWIVATNYGPMHYAVDDAAYPLNTYEATASMAARGCAENGFLDNAREMTGRLQ